MASALKSLNLPHFLGKNYEIAFNQSLEALLKSPVNPNSKETYFMSDFRSLVQSRADPPLETIWVFSALSFNSQRAPNAQLLDRILAVKDLFQLIVSCSASCGSGKSIALVAPVIYNLHKLILEGKSLQLGTKIERKVKCEIGSLVDSIVGYIIVCCSGFDGGFDNSEGLRRPLGELISFWVVDEALRNENVESLRVFFPLLSDDVVKRVSEDGCGMLDLVGFVITEAFLLKLCRKVKEGVGEKMQNELKPWIVGSITGFRNSYFYVTLASMLLEQMLPTTSIMNKEDEEGLRKILFDALILPEYSFLSPEGMGRLPDKQAKRVNLTRLMVTDEAIDWLRDHGEHTKAASCLSAFAWSPLPAQIIKTIKTETGDKLNVDEPNGSSPKAFLRWMLNIENRGIKILDDDMSNYRSKFMSCDMKEATERLTCREDLEKPDSDPLFYIDNKGQEQYENEKDEDMGKSMSAAFMAAAHSMESSEHGGKKRKSKKGEKMKKVKFVKYNLSDNSSLPRERSAVSRNEDSDSGGEIDNPHSSEED